MELKTKQPSAMDSVNSAECPSGTYLTLVGGTVPFSLMYSSAAWSGICLVLIEK